MRGATASHGFVKCSRTSNASIRSKLFGSNDKSLGVSLTKSSDHHGPALAAGRWHTDGYQEAPRSRLTVSARNY
jgi:hypothetical protein